MNWMLPFLAMTLGGWIGWALGSRLGIMTAYLLSVVGGAVGFYLGRKLTRNLIG